MAKQAMGYDAAKMASSNGAWKPRRWRGHWLHCCGECSPEDAVGCFFGYSNPCGAAYSWNVSKVLHLSFWRELLKFFAIIMLSAWIFDALQWAKLYQCLIKPFFMGLDAGSQGTELDPEALQQMTAACTTASILENVGALMFLVCLICWALFVGGKRRRQMREELGIPVSAEGRCCSCCHNSGDHCNDDCCLHFWCMPCAVAQETRTILHEEALGSMPPRLVGSGYKSGLAGEMLLVAPHDFDDMQRSAALLPV
eukprot:GHUV01000652.1.p1 GENE.GHUV01000652.1~~GHUV01000652.1.p1  ORF type:complete len:254 (+),score=51.82 GHUV01000652.1:239-1000(+)